MLRVLVVDDHTVVREGLKRIIDDGADMKVEGEAANAAEALDRLRNQRFDVAVVDMNLPGRDGIDLLADLKREYPKMRVLILSFYAEEAYAVRALQAGADGYVTKDSGATELLGAIAKVGGGAKFVTPVVAEQLAHAAAATEQTPHARLSAREFEVFRLIASGLEVSEVAAQLALSVKTVSTYRARVLEKMKLRTNAQLTQYAFKNRLLE